MSSGYHSLQLTIKNDAHSYYILSPDSFSVELALPKKVAKTFDPSWGIIIATLPIELVFLATNHLELYLGTLSLSGLGINLYNNYITKRFTNKSVNPKYELVIAPHEQLEKYFFIHEKNFSPHFSITLINGKDGSKIPFNVDLNPLSQKNLYI